ncbi:MAG: hypothetical protein JKY67_12905 [Pseudomonadales bacterium]|nr:hypothetical protein [Pseudomonadales bacterium]
MTDSQVWTLTADSDGAAFRHQGGTLHYALNITSGTGTLKLQVSYDEGTTYQDVTGVSLTANGQGSLTGYPAAVLFRPNLSGSAASPSFVVNAYSVRT